MFALDTNVLVYAVDESSPYHPKCSALLQSAGFPPLVQRAALLEAGFAAAWIALVSGPFIAGFAVELRAGPLAQGFLVSLPDLASIAQLVSAYFVETRGYAAPPHCGGRLHPARETRGAGFGGSLRSCLQPSPFRRFLVFYLFWMGSVLRRTSLCSKSRRRPTTQCTSRPLAR